MLGPGDGPVGVSKCAGAARHPPAASCFSGGPVLDAEKNPVFPSCWHV